MKNLISVIIILFSVNAFSFALDVIDKPIQEALVWDKENQNIADRASDILQLGLTYAPIPMAIAEDKPTKMILGMAAAQVSVGLVTQGAKVFFNRERPNTHNRRSFWSGHSSAAWAGATAFCGMDKDACIPAYLMAGATSYLRVAANRHYFSDVVVGAMVGYSGGRQIPKLIIGKSW